MTRAIVVSATCKVCTCPSTWVQASYGDWQQSFRRAAALIRGMPLRGSVFPCHCVGSCDHEEGHVLIGRSFSTINLPRQHPPPRNRPAHPPHPTPQCGLWRAPSGGDRKPLCNSVTLEVCLQSDWGLLPQPQVIHHPSNRTFIFIISFLI